MDFLGTKILDELMEIMDPYAYIETEQLLKIPKFIICGSEDEFFVNISHFLEKGNMNNFLEKDARQSKILLR